MINIFWVSVFELTFAQGQTGSQRYSSALEPIHLIFPPNFAVALVIGHAVDPVDSDVAFTVHGGTHGHASGLLMGAAHFHTTCNWSRDITLSAQSLQHVSFSHVSHKNYERESTKIPSFLCTSAEIGHTKSAIGTHVDKTLFHSVEVADQGHTSTD